MIKIITISIFLLVLLALTSRGLLDVNHGKVIMTPSGRIMVQDNQWCKQNQEKFHVVDTR